MDGDAAVAAASAPNSNLIDDQTSQKKGEANNSTAELMFLLSILLIKMVKTIIPVLNKITGKML